MIMRQWREIIQGKKTQTRRVVKYGHEIKFSVDGFSIYASPYVVGKDYAVVPKRGQRAIWWKRSYYTGRIYNSLKHMDWSVETLIDLNWQQLRIRIKDIRTERLQAISEADACAEGVESVAAYRDLWQSINGKTKGARWDDNPLCWVITFEVVL